MGDPPALMTRNRHGKVGFQSQRTNKIGGILRENGLDRVTEPEGIKLNSLFFHTKMTDYPRRARTERKRKT